MKKILLVAIMVLLFQSFSFSVTPPAIVQKAFEAKFKTATNVKWGKEGKTEWEATFSYEGNKLSANFAENGAWLETEKKIKIADLPKAVSAAIKTNYSDWTITEADKTDTSKHGIIYEADLKKVSTKKEVAFKEDGTPIIE